MKKKILIAVGVVVVAAVLLVVIVPPSADVAEVREGDIVETLVATGQIVPASRAALVADVSAGVEQVEVSPGDSVQEGEVLVRLDDDAARAGVDEAEAGVAEARARLEGVADSGATAAREQLEQARVTLQGAREEYERARELFDHGLVTRAEVGEARRTVQRAESDVQRAQSAYEQTRREGSDFDQAAAGLERAAAQLRSARRRLDDYTLRAPVDATVLTRPVDPGDSVQPGTTVATLAADGPRHLRIQPDERHLDRLSAGQPAVVATDARPHERLEATVWRIEPVVDAERGTATVQLRLETPPEHLRADMTATADIELERREDALVLPRRAVRQLDTDTPWVLRVEDRRAVRVDVRVGLEDDRRVEIVEGLDRGELVVADPKVEPGDRIRRSDQITVDDEPPDRREPAPQTPGEPGAHRPGEAP